MDAERGSGAAEAPLVDPFGRRVTYLRVSVTDRCDFRCVYCMADVMTFLPKAELLTLEELDRVCSAFVRAGVRKLRITGGEPLVRRGVIGLFQALSRHLQTGALDELTLTTNASRLATFAPALTACGVRRVNVSLDTLDPELFRRITRIGDFGRVMAGIDAAAGAGLRVKINVVALRGVNEHELSDIIRWCGRRGFDMTLIEVMPMGDLGGEDRREQYLSLAEVRARLQRQWTLTPLPMSATASTGGPARYVRVEEAGVKLGFITPLTHNFCEACNRVRLTCTGRLYMCLGQEDFADLRAAVRAEPGDARIEAAIRAAIDRKPRGHDFVIDREAREPAVPRLMNVTGG